MNKMTPTPALDANEGEINSIYESEYSKLENGAYVTNRGHVFVKLDHQSFRLSFDPDDCEEGVDVKKASHRMAEQFNIGFKRVMSSALSTAPEVVTPTRDEVVDLLAVMWDGYENGTPCYESTDDPEENGSSIGKAFEVDADIEGKICDLLNKERPVNGLKITAAPNGGG